MRNGILKEEIDALEFRIGVLDKEEKELVPEDPKVVGPVVRKLDLGDEDD